MSARRDAHAAYLSLTLRERGLPTDAAVPDPPLRRLIFDRWLPASLFALIATPNIFLFAEMFGDGSSALNLSRQALTSMFVVLMASLFLVRRDRLHDFHPLRALHRPTALAGPLPRLLSQAPR